MSHKEVTVEEFEDILYNDEYAPVTDSKITDQSRWYTYYERTFQKKDDGTFWTLTWSRGSTEQQDEGLMDTQIVQVEPVSVTVIEYKEIAHQEK